MQPELWKVGNGGNGNLSRSQRRRIVRFSTKQCVDIHCHCLAGVDDGPKDTAEALDLCRALVADGITTVIATCHQLGRYVGRNSTAEICSAVASLNAALRNSHLPLKVLPGADVRIDERITEFLAESKVTTLCDAGRYLLIELPFETYVNLGPLLRELASLGVSLILSHPERYSYLCKRPALAESWLEEGLTLQITAGSLLGQFGSMAMQAGWSWLARGEAGLVATDAHDRDVRRPCMTQAIEAICHRLGAEAARRVCLTNPIKILEGLPVESGLARAGQRGRP